LFQAYRQIVISSRAQQKVAGTDYDGALYPTRGSRRAEMQPAFEAQLQTFMPQHKHNMLAFLNTVMSSHGVELTAVRKERIWKEWEAFCNRFGLPDPFLRGGWGFGIDYDEDVLISWVLEECGNRGIQEGTMWKKLYTVSEVHRLHRFKDPLQDVPLLRKVMKGIKLYRPPGSRRKLALSVPVLKVIKLMKRKTHDIDDFKLWCAIFSMFSMLARSQEAVACLKGGKFDLKKVWQVKDLKFYKDKVEISEVQNFHMANEVEFFFESQKGGNKNKGDYRSHFVTSNPDLCLVRDLATMRQMEPNARPEDPLFSWSSGSNRFGDGVRRCDVAQIIKEAAHLCGIPEAILGTHSCRRGGATALRIAGTPMDQIKIFGRWASDVFDIYVQDHSGIMVGVLDTMLGNSVTGSGPRIPTLFRDAEKVAQSRLQRVTSYGRVGV
jgi:hypothetical protein